MIRDIKYQDIGTPSVPYLVASSPLCYPILVEIKREYDRRNTTVFSNIEEINMFRPFSGCAIIMLITEYRRKPTHYNVDV
jgi:hypothetical protein